VFLILKRLCEDLPGGKVKLSRSARQRQDVSEVVPCRRPVCCAAVRWFTADNDYIAGYPVYGLGVAMPLLRCRDFCFDERYEEAASVLSTFASCAEDASFPNPV